MRKYSIPRLTLTLILGAYLCWTALDLGCAASFLSGFGASNNVPTAPGHNPYIVLRFVNTITGAAQSATATQPGSAVFDATWRYAGGGKDYFGYRALPGSTQVMSPGEDLGTILPCDISVLTVGDVDDLTATGAWVSWSGSVVLQDLPPMGRLLQNGTDFRCGDVVTFMLEPNNDIAQRFNITWRVDSGQNESGPYTGPDTFANLDRMTTQWEKDTGITIPYPYIP